MGLLIHHSYTIFFLNRLDTGYVDLFLIHTPSPGRIVETYDGLLKMKEEGLIRLVNSLEYKTEDVVGNVLQGNGWLQSF
jgi:aryl-alcohol dehydrogenase-like predicted oxidoreductase